MKRSEVHDFTLPTRQSYAAIVLIMYKLYKVLLRQLFPFLVLILIQGKFSKSSTFLYVIIGAAVVASIYSIIAFFKYFFYIKGDKLIVQKGVFKKSTLEIPFDRVQSINFEQNLLHRLFGVVKLNIDTAGSSKNELELNALNHDLATALSEVILGHEKKKILSGGEEIEHDHGKKEIIFRLRLRNLLKVGLTVNHIRSGGVILFFFLWLFDNLRDVGLDMYEKLDEYTPMAEAISKSIALVMAFLIILAVASLIISMVRVVLQYYDLKMYRKDNGFVIESGLLNRKEYAARDAKIQMVSWSQNLLQKMSGIYSISMKQASSIEVKTNKSLRVVGLSANDVDRTQAYVFKRDYHDIKEMNFEGVNIYYLIRRLSYWTMLACLTGLITWVLDKEKAWIYIILIYAYGVLSFF